MRIAVLILVFLIQGCVNLPRCEDPIVPSASSSSRIIVYRESKLMGFGAFQYVGVNQCLLGMLKNGSYLQYELAPGKNLVSVYNDVGVKRFEMALMLEPQSTVFLKFRFDVTDTLVSTGAILVAGKESLEIVTKEQALSELKELENI